MPRRTALRGLQVSPHARDGLLLEAHGSRRGELCDDGAGAERPHAARPFRRRDPGGSTRGDIRDCAEHGHGCPACVGSEAEEGSDGMITALFVLALRWALPPDAPVQAPRPIVREDRQWGVRQRRSFRAPGNFYR